MNAPTTTQGAKDLFDNPAGLDGFEFVEFCAPEKGMLEPVFEAMGFTRVAQHRSKDVHLWRQGGLNYTANSAPPRARWYFARQHCPPRGRLALRGCGGVVGYLPLYV